MRSTVLDFFSNTKTFVLRETGVSSGTLVWKEVGELSPHEGTNNNPHKMVNQLTASSPVTWHIKYLKDFPNMAQVGPNTASVHRSMADRGQFNDGEYSTTVGFLPVLPLATWR